ncbi:hypothetical protein [Helicobacter pylori]|uniref:hypothetical protein n=1 Tax=Helicobacter pylori TaxID=210 RepID=UPI001F275E71|nr:hypothetical protein [Helicobacter pylori]
MFRVLCTPYMIDNNNTTLADLLENGEPAIYYEANSANIRRFLDRGSYNIEWLMRKYLEVGFRSCKVERIRETKFVIKFRYKKWGSMIDREVKMQFPKYLKDSKREAVKITSRVFYELSKKAPVWQPPRQRSHSGDSNAEGKQ